MDLDDLSLPSNQGLKTTQFGFQWGPMVAERVGYSAKGNHVVRIGEGDKAVYVSVSPSGKSVRAYDTGGNELK